MQSQPQWPINGVQQTVGQPLAVPSSSAGAAGGLQFGGVNLNVNVSLNNGNNNRNYRNNLNTSNGDGQGLGNNAGGVASIGVAGPGFMNGGFMPQQVGRNDSGNGNDKPGLLSMSMPPPTYNSIAHNDIQQQQQLLQRNMLNLQQQQQQPQQLQIPGGLVASILQQPQLQQQQQLPPPGSVDFNNVLLGAIQSLSETSQFGLCQQSSDPLEWQRRQQQQRLLQVGALALAAASSLSSSASSSSPSPPSASASARAATIGTCSTQQQQQQQSYSLPLPPSVPAAAPYYHHQQQQQQAPQPQLHDALLSFPEFLPSTEATAAASASAASLPVLTASTLSSPQDPARLSFTASLPRPNSSIIIGDGNSSSNTNTANHEETNHRDAIMPLESRPLHIDIAAAPPTAAAATVTERAADLSSSPSSSASAAAAVATLPQQPTNTGKRRFRNYQANLWQTRYQDLIEFRNRFGHCDVPYSWQENQPLAQWVKRMRYQKRLSNMGKKSTMTQERFKALSALNFCWDYHEAAWNEKFNELQQFHSKFGHCDVPAKYPANPQLSIWVKRQRKQYAEFKSDPKASTTMTPNRLRKLISVGFDCELRSRASLSPAPSEAALSSPLEETPSSSSVGAMKEEGKKKQAPGSLKEG